ncbi:MAG: response regulator [Acidobacteria bacterium]|nr:response regulator [Acidobacteriota bacterium]
MNQKSVLIVDDDNSICSSLASLLKSELVETRIASTMEEAEMLLRTETFNLALVDLRLRGSEGTEGLDLISRIKARAPETRVVLFTAYGSPEIEQEALRRGAVEYWEKRMKIPTLIERIRALGIPVGREKVVPEFADSNGFCGR